MKFKTSFLPIFFFFLVTLASISGQELCFSGFFKPNTTYDLNRRQIFSYLASNVKANNGFYSSSNGQIPNRIFIIAMCIPGTKPDICSDCIKGASDSLLHTCPNQIEAYTWLDCCMVRYSNSSFSGSLVMEPSKAVTNTKDVNSNFTVFDRIGEKLVSSTMNQDPLKTHGHKYYAAEVASVTNFQTVYAMMQCTPDLSSRDCGFCLKANLRDYDSSCRGQQAGSVSRPVCFIRWDLQPYAGAFENITSTPSQQQSQPPVYLSPPVNDQANVTGKDRKTTSTGSIVSIVVPAIVVLILLVLGLVFWRRRTLHQKLEGQDGDKITTTDSLQLSFKTIESATDKFSDSNLIGRGGFGEVYRGILSNGTEVAVKRLSKTSGQGTQEFKTEAVLVTKLQHKNLVRLLGFCLQGEEKILVYEFVPNKSLDYFLFDNAKKRELDWTRRYNIIGGIARGILYLHHDSRLTIIHRDLKASNILLDSDMNPKIADFGMARIYKIDQTHANTRRIVGTYGYMPPEYAMRGHFSMKSDVYSFGVMILEIISGKRNKNFYNIDNSPGNLVTYAWRLWRNSSPLELVDPIILESYDSNEAIRCIHIALLCVQENPTDRPLLPAIIMMLTSTTMTLSVPRAPGFCLSSGNDTASRSTSRSIPGSINDVTITDLDPR